MSTIFIKNTADDDQASTVAPSELSSDHESMAEVERLVATENERVRYSKAAMFALLVAAAFGCSYAAFAVTRRAEDKDFRAKVGRGWLRLILFGPRLIVSHSRVKRFDIGNALTPSSFAT